MIVIRLFLVLELVLAMRFYFHIRLFMHLVLLKVVILIFLRKMPIALSNLLERSGGTRDDFLKAATEVQQVCACEATDLLAIGKMFTSGDYLSTIPSQYRGTMRQLGEQYLAVAQELQNPAGVAFTLGNLATEAASDPDTYMPQIAQWG